MTTPDDPRHTALRSLPAVDQVATWPELAALSREPRLAAIRAELDAVRTALRAGELEQAPARSALARAILERAARERRRGLVSVVNATGVLLHTNLGRAPMGEAVLHALSHVLGACNLEYELGSGQRGRRGDGVLARLCALSGAEAALVVNNCAAAVLLAIAALCSGREVVVSRGELVEIGGSFRVPDVVVHGGARLREVGTTNRTRVADYAAAIGPDTAALLKTHASNFALVGFTAEVSRAELVALARGRDPAPPEPIRVIEDLGAATFLPLLGPEHGALDAPSARAALEDGVDLVLFSADKLLGGPQAGIALGRADAIERMRRHPLYRALRPGKLTLAALEATLALHAEPSRGAHGLVLHAQAACSLEALRQRAAALVEALGDGPGRALDTAVVETEATLGGGALPGQLLPSVGLSVARPGGGDGGELAARLRAAAVPIVGRVHEGRVILDLRTVPEMHDALVLEALHEVAATPET